MSDPTTPPPADQSAAPSPIKPAVTPAPGRKASNVKAWAVGGAALIVALCCGGVGIAALSGDDTDTAAGGRPPMSASPTSAASTTVAPTTAAATTMAPTPTLALYDEPTKKDFKLAVKVLRKQCFGSAGCNISYRIDVTYTGSGLDPAKTYEVTYEVRGGEDPMINTFEVTGDTASVPQEEHGSTRRSGDKLTAVVTDVAEL
ncbi:hypothetical protein [Micromonospora coxensis]|uniref:Uncharacterized protein n=1 Tax=Micromonospora coxensis TaxID=356852 RepID=A0A1C5K1G3_9ACTN|nr:hypothetical protein [Micromonospora coxensis]SCG76588.1 hypothetical protein GA0070614_5957 [Micromonospora coxensis]